MPAQAEGALRMRLFGPFEVWLGDRSLSLAFGHSKDAQLLALLSLHAGAMLAHDWLVSRIWPDTLSIESLRQSVIRVRTALGTQGDRLTTRPGCYGLDLSGADVDVISFDRAWANPEDDVAALERAVALYRGPLLCDWYDDPED
jgi:DNA-binding SARP family transcriptional activator